MKDIFSTVEVDLFDILSILIAYQGFSFGLYFIINRFLSHRANLLLCVFYLSLASNFLFIFFLGTGVVPYAKNPGLFFGLSYGPLIYYYTKYLMDPKNNFLWIEVLHFFPAMSTIIILSFAGPDMIQFMIVATFLAFAHIILYIILSYTAIRRFVKGLDHALSKTEEADLSWLYQLLFTMVILFAIVGLESLAQIYLSTFWDNLSMVLVFGSVLVFSNVLFFKGTKYSQRFKGLSLNSKDVILDANEKYSGSKLSPSQGEELVEELRKIMDSDKPFLKEDITIEELASMTSMSPRTLSQVINQFLNKNYYDFVNSYRIEYASELLKTQRDLRINEVMYESGFSSKSTFNQVFKEQTGQTPTEFRRN